jgi:erythromycin esterase-like protein
MAETVRHLLGEDSTRKIVVWLHNDHARYGAWQAGPLRIRAAGSVLREWMGDDVFSVGLLMGSGEFVDNSRRPRTIPEPPAGSIETVFAGAGHPEGLLPLGWKSSDVGAWADREHAYLRGDQIFRMRPGQEFDALVWFAKVSPATYPPRN